MPLANYDAASIYKYQQSMQGAVIATVLANLDSYTEFTSVTDILDRKEFQIIDQNSKTDKNVNPSLWTVSYLSDDTCNVFMNLPIHSQLLLICATMNIPLEVIPRYQVLPNNAVFAKISICNKNLVEHLKSCIERYGSLKGDR